MPIAYARFKSRAVRSSVHNISNIRYIRRANFVHYRGRDQFHHLARLLPIYHDMNDQVNQFVYIAFTYHEKFQIIYHICSKYCSEY